MAKAYKYLACVILLTIVTANKVAKYQIFSTNVDNFEVTSSHTGYGWAVKIFQIQQQIYQGLHG